MDRALRGSLEETGLSSELLAVEEKEKIRHFNSGVFLFRPSKELGMRILSAFNESPLLSTFKFPDQDFLRYFFQHRYLPLPWQYNAVKTSRTWHPDLWRDEEVICLHYIVDKPWTKVGQDGLAGCVGNDSVTYTLWWASFRRWRKETEVLGKAGQEILQIVNQFVDNDDETRSKEVKRSGAGQ
ncbi:MAG: hypothetical protein M1822_010216 [Bathelium mastoideum]|nr:MAG: hypothetical protein M1822_010216 [Bathelium mastoideum]